MPGPLDGIRVFDVTMYMAGPWASMLLGSLGAEVLHVERPDADWGTLNAGAPPLVHGTASGYLAWNMNKRGLALDLKDPDDLRLAYDLIETCDVFTTNMRPVDRMGLSAEKLRAINPRLVYCHITGFGRTGPRSGDPATDTRLQTFAGVWSTQGSRGGLGEFYRHATQVDATTGNLLTQAALLGLHARKRTGEGQYVEVTMLDAAATLQLPRLAEHFGGVTHRPHGSSAFATAPDRAFRCEDGRWIGVSVTGEDEWLRLCVLLERPELASDPRFAVNTARVEHRAALEAVLAADFAARPRVYWELFLSRAEVPWGAPMLWEHLRHHEQVLANDYLVEVPTVAWGTVWTGGPPWRFSRTPARMVGAPIPGIDTDELREEVDGTEVEGTAVERATGDRETVEGDAIGALAGTRVVEVSEGVAGPLLARLLGDAGADVVKVEPPGGDRARGWAPQVDGVAAAFGTLNRNKRSIAVTEDPAALVAELAASADVVVLDHELAVRMGVDVPGLLEHHPDVVVCVISAWGPAGPWADRLGGDLPAQLASETTASLGRPGDEPVRMGTDHAGVACALYGFQAVTAALLVADDGGGQRIDVSLFGALVHMRTALWIALSNPDEWWGFHLDSYTNPPEHFYTCSDRRVLFQAEAIADRVALMKDLGMEWVFDDLRWPKLREDTGAVGRYSAEVHELWDRGLARWTFAEAEEIFRRHGGSMYPCLTYDEFLDDPQVEHVGLVVDGVGSVTRDLRPPWQLDATPALIRTPAPRLDEHGAEIRAELLGTARWAGRPS